MENEAGQAGQAEKPVKPKKFLTSKDIADHYSVSTKTVRVWAKKGKLKAVTTLGGHRRYKPSALKDLSSPVA